MNSSVMAGSVIGEFTTDAQDKIASGGIKYDGGKSAVFRGCLAYFPRAMEAVAAVSQFGASKYAWNGWRGVDDRLNRYSDAMVRHLTSEAKGENLDPDSGLPHRAHAAWNALATLEIILQEADKVNAWTGSGVAAPMNSATK